MATGLGKALRASTQKDKPMRLVANGTTGRPEFEAPEASEDDAMADRDRRLSRAESKDLFARQRDIDYLDIPSFLRNQAD